MAWIRLDDQIAHHPKFLKAGNSAWMYVGCIGYASRYLTDGFIPADAIGFLAGGVRKPQSHINKLVVCGLLEKVPGGYQVHDYLKHNDSAETIKRKREVDRIRKESERTSRGIHAESERNPKSVLARAPASVPVPIPFKEQKIKAAAAPRIPRDGNGYPLDLSPSDNLGVITKLVHTVIAAEKSVPDFASLKDLVKCRCKKAKILCDSVVVGMAIESALEQRKRRAH